jgi:hypothetical protein
VVKDGVAGQGSVDGEAGADRVESGTRWGRGEEEGRLHLLVIRRKEMRQHHYFVSILMLTYTHTHIAPTNIGTQSYL